MPVGTRLKAKDQSLKALKPAEDKKERDYLFEGYTGFGVRIRPTGTIVFYYKYRFKGKLRFLNLGTYSATSLAGALKKYGDAFQLRKNGFDPIEVEAEHTRVAKAEEALNLQNSLTVGELIDQYIKEYAKPNKKTWHKDELTLNKDLRPKWGSRPAIEINKRDVTLMLQAIIDRGSPGQAQNVLESGRAMYNWAVDQDILQTTPFLGVKRPSPKNTKDRALSEKEIQIFWNELDKASMSDEIRRALKLTLLTAQRAGEVIGTPAAEINGRWWTIPKERSKNKKAHRVYLTEMALELFGELTAVDSKTGEPVEKEFLFPCPHKTKNKAIGESAMGHALRNNFKSKKFSMAIFTPHDLRRTAVTNLARLKIPKEWRERVVNHLPKELDGIYNQYEYDDEKKHALTVWEADLKRILGIK